MLLHNYPNEFKDLVAIVADQMHLPESAIERDYYIAYLLKNLVDSEYSEQCVFKGGTSLSKCYPGSIERFSEDIDLTFLGMDLSDKECDRMIKRIESVMTSGAETEKINAERSNRSKSMFVWFNSKEDKIKLEIGSSVRPDPYSKKSVKTYIQESNVRRIDDLGRVVNHLRSYCCSSVKFWYILKKLSRSRKRKTLSERIRLCTSMSRCSIRTPLISSITILSKRRLSSTIGIKTKRF